MEGQAPSDDRLEPLPLQAITWWWDQLGRPPDGRVTNGAGVLKESGDVVGRFPPLAPPVIGVVEGLVGEHREAVVGQVDRAQFIGLRLRHGSSLAKGHGRMRYLSNASAQANPLKGTMPEQVQAGTPTPP